MQGGDPPVMLLEKRQRIATGHMHVTGVQDEFHLVRGLLQQERDLCARVLEFVRMVMVGELQSLVAAIHGGAVQCLGFAADVGFVRSAAQNHPPAPSCAAPSAIRWIRSSGAISVRGSYSSRKMCAAK